MANIDAADGKEETKEDSVITREDSTKEHIDDAIKNLSLDPDLSSGMFRALGTIFQASQMHEGPFEARTDGGVSDLWSTLQQAAKLESEDIQDVPCLIAVDDILLQLQHRKSKLLQPALRILANASREEKWRVPLGESGIVELCLDLLASSALPSAIRTQCLRLVGNSCADTDQNRARVVSHRNFSALIESLRISEIVNVAVPALYNVCCDFGSASKEAATMGLYEALIELLRSDILEDSPAFGYLCRLLDLAIEFLDPSRSPVDSVELLLKCGTKPGLDTEDIVSLVDAAVAHLQLEKFQQHLVDEDLVGVPLRFIVRSYFPSALLSGSSVPTVDAKPATPREPEDEAELSRIRRSLIQALSDVSALPSFALRHSSLETPLVRSLIGWITAELPHVQLCACIILGNLAREDRVCTLTVAQTNVHKDLISVARSNKDTQVLHSSLAFLRNLALPAQNKAILGDCNILDALTRFWSSEFMPQISHVATGIARQLVIGNIANVERILAPISNDPESPANMRTYLSLLLSLFDRTDEIVVKMEVARTIAGILRCIHSTVEDASVRDAALQRLFTRHQALGVPLGVMVSQTQSPIIRSEGWFAMALMARNTEGAAILGTVVADANVYSALEAAVGMQGTEAVSEPSVAPLIDSQSVVSSEPPVQTDDMKAKDRENAMIFINGLLQEQSGDLLSTIRRSALEEMMEAGARSQNA